MSSSSARSGTSGRAREARPRRAQPQRVARIRCAAASSRRGRGGPSCSRRLEPVVALALLELDVREEQQRPAEPAQLARGAGQLAHADLRQEGLVLALAERPGAAPGDPAGRRSATSRARPAPAAAARDRPSPRAGPRRRAWPRCFPKPAAVNASRTSRSRKPSARAEGAAMSSRSRKDERTRSTARHPSRDTAHSGKLTRWGAPAIRLSSTARVRPRRSRRSRSARRRAAARRGAARRWRSSAGRRRRCGRRRSARRARPGARRAPRRVTTGPHGPVRALYGDAHPRWHRRPRGAHDEAR